MEGTALGTSSTPTSVESKQLSSSSSSNVEETALDAARSAWPSVYEVSTEEANAFKRLSNEENWAPARTAGHGQQHVRHGAEEVGSVRCSDGSEVPLYACAFDGHLKRIKFVFSGLVYFASNRQVVALSVVVPRTTRANVRAICLDSAGKVSLIPLSELREPQDALLAVSKEALTGLIAEHIPAKTVSRVVLNALGERISNYKKGE